MPDSLPHIPLFGPLWLPRLSVDIRVPRQGMFDGAWWPRTAYAADELPSLVTAIDAYIGRVLRISIHLPEWHHIPHSIVVDHRSVKISPIPTSAHTITLTRRLDDQILLLVVPPDTRMAAALAAMAAAVDGHAAVDDDLLRSGNPTAGNAR
jgi:hypothetical protein